MSLVILSSCASSPGGSGGGGSDTPPAITQQPANQSVTVGQAATFSVMAAGTAPLTYQWFLNGAATGTNASTFAITSVTANQDQSTVYVTVSNSKGTATSTTAKLSVAAAVTAPAITTQPAPQTVTAGQTATFTVAANGTAPLTYQWYLNGTAVGTNSATYVVANTTTSQNGATVDVTVSNSTGSVTSNTVKLTVNAAATAPTITTQPTAQTVTAGQTATFTVAANGTAPLTYQWHLNGSAVGTNSATYAVSNTTTSQNGASVYVTVSNSVNSVTSNTVKLTVNATATAPTITTQPTAQTVTAGQSATFTVAANGTTPLTYQWYLNGSAAGTNSATYTITNTTTAQNGATIYVKVSNSAGNATSSTVKVTVNAAASVPTITTQPTPQTVTAGQTATFTVAANGSAPLTYQWTLNGATAGTNSATYSITNTTTSQSGDQVNVKVSNSAGSVTSNTVALTVNGVAPPSNVNVLTYHNDVARTGQNLNETILTTSNVTSANFGKIGVMNADGLVDAEPLYVSGLTVNGATHNVVYVATENDTLYAYDADTFTQLWKASLLGANETASDSRGCYQVTPQIGITSTPVIDLKAGTHGTIFAVAMSKDSQGNYYQRLHALDLTTGAEQSDSPTTVQATFTMGSTTTTFSPMQYKERAALLLLNGNIYTTWASHCDDGPYQGWAIAYSESTLEQTSVLNITPNGSNGAIWMSGDGPAADSSGNIYFLAGNGTFDDTLNSNGFPEKGDYGNGFIKVATTSTSMSVADYFTMYNTDSESDADQDLGSGGELLLPDLQDAQMNVWHLAVGAGKDGHIYLANRDLMGKFNTSNDSAIYQEIDTNGLAGGVWATPAYFNGTLYYGAVSDSLRAFTITNAKLVTPASSVSADIYYYPGATPSISANGTSNGIVWAIQNNNGGVLYAYDATNLTKELYNSNQATNGRDNFADNKYVTPMIANGKVYVATPTGVTVFGLFQ
jgi:Immunoglobulin domain